CRPTLTSTGAGGMPASRSRSRSSLPSASASAALGERSSCQTRARCTLIAPPRTSAATTCSWFWSQSIARKRGMGGWFSVACLPFRAACCFAKQQAELLPLAQVEPFAQLRDVAHVDDARPAEARVDDRLQPRYRAAALEVA